VRSSFPYASAVAAGAIVGVCGPLLASAGGQVGHAAHLVLSAGWGWAALAFCLGMMSEPRRRSAVTGAVSLLAAVLAYYLTKAGQGDFRSVDFHDPTGQTTYFSWDGFLSMTAVWGFFACLLGPALGMAGNAARNGPYRLPCRLVVPFVAIVETSMRLRVEAPLQAPVVATTWSATRAVAVGVVLVLVVHAVAGRRRRRSAGRVRA